MPSRLSALSLLDELIGELSQPPAGKASPLPTAAKPSVAIAKAAAAKAEVAAPAAPAAACSEDVFPATVALYQTDTYLLTSDATVLAIEPLDGDAGWAVVLDRTVFHPQGGGQPADVGTLQGESGVPFAVGMVRKGLTGVVRHEGASPPPFAVGSRVRCAVRGESRLLSARVHSAGHLIDVAMTASGMADRLRPTKGYHFTPGSYVEYEGGKLEAAERDALLAKLQAGRLCTSACTSAPSAPLRPLHSLHTLLRPRHTLHTPGTPCTPLHPPAHPCARCALPSPRAPSHRRVWTSWSRSPSTRSSTRLTPRSSTASARPTPSPRTAACGAAAGCVSCAWAGWAARAAARTWRTRASCAPSLWGPSSPKAR